MKPIKFKQQNTIISGGEVEALELPCFQGYDELGFPVIVSFWEVSPKQLETIFETGGIYLTVYGSKTPPISLSETSPFQ